MVNLWKAFEESTKLWQILRIALIDIKKAEKRDDVCVVMSFWHRKATQELNCLFKKPLKWQGCYVCLAGSVLLRRRPDLLAAIDFLPGDIVMKIHALDLLRNGYIDDALACMQKKTPKTVRNIRVTPYWEDKKAWHTCMKDILELLKGKNL